jgi:metal transporter CNNM
VEGQGALNFLALDDVPVYDEGEVVDPDSVLQLEFEGERPVFPRIEPRTDDDLIQAINRSGKSWVIIVDSTSEPRLVLNSDTFIREALFAPDCFNPYRHCHRPIVVRDERKRLGELIPRFRVRPGPVEDDIVENDVILLWNEQPKILTGTDILGRLLRGIVKDTPSHSLDAIL